MRAALSVDLMSDDFTEKLLGCSWAPMMGLKSNQCNEVWQMSVLLRTITLLAVQLHILTPSGPTWQTLLTLWSSHFFFSLAGLDLHMWNWVLQLPECIKRRLRAVKVVGYSVKTRPISHITKKNLHFHRVHNWVYWYPVLTIEIFFPPQKSESFMTNQ